MGVRLAHLVALAALLAAPSVAAPVKHAAPAAGQCRVVGANRLPPSVRRSSICSAIARAMTRQAPGARYSVAVQIVTPSWLRATLTIDGRVLPEQNFAVSDGELDRGHIRHFADNLAASAVRR